MSLRALWAEKPRPTRTQGELRREPQCADSWRRDLWPDNTLSGRGGPATPAAPAAHTKDGQGRCQTGPTSTCDVRAVGTYL